MRNILNESRKITRQLIGKSFPKLKDRRINLFLSPIGFYAFCLPGNFIGITKECNKLTKNELKGILAHELCHAEQYLKMGLFKSKIQLLHYFLSSKFKMKVEIEADKMAIKKGYAKELFLSAKKIRLKIFDNEKIYGLSPLQIKSYAKKIGK
jgi:hypothetical protein